MRKETVVMRSEMRGEAAPLHGWSKYTGRRVRIMYQDRRGRWTLRTVVPYAWGEEWMKAHCCERGAPRLFRLDRIMALQPEEPGRPERSAERRGEPGRWPGEGPGRWPGGGRRSGPADPAAAMREKERSG
jgi:hypothetical protein